MAILTIKIPNIFDTPYVIIPQTLLDSTYYFEYQWNIRHELLYLSIYTLNDEEKIYLVKNIALINRVEISRYIISDNWKGLLRLYSDKSYDFGYNIKTVSDDFYLFYNSEYIGKH